MQKLLRTAQPILSVNTNFLAGGFCASPHNIEDTMFSSTVAIRHPHSFHEPRNIPSLGARLGKVSPSSCRLCSCSVDNGGNPVPFRPWVVMKESCSGNIGSASRAPWFSTLACDEHEGAERLAVPSENDGELEAENVKTSLRRRRSGDIVGPVGPQDLLAIPGVGPRNLRKLVDKGFEGVAHLKQLYKDKFYGKSSRKMVEFLQSSVGIIHKSHAESITTFIKESVDAELSKDGSKSAQKKRITLCIEGNISVGKTTFLQRIANETLELRDLVEIVPEPVDKWQNVGPDQFNILDAFYAEPERYAYTFQNYVFVTRVMQEKESSGGIKPLRLMERSVFSDRMVFVRAVHEAKWMNEMEISIYDSWFDPVVSSLPGLIPDGFIYLRASPGACHKRMMLRKRAEEVGVSLDYLRDLREKHESWLFPFQSGHHGVLSVNKLPNDSDLHPKIQDRVFYLDGNHMHSSIQKVPAMVLDCEADIDFSRDVEAKQEYASQVAEFFEFVKKKKEASASKAEEEGSVKSNQPQVMLPCTEKLWMPGVSPFSNSPLKSLQYRHAVTFTPQ